MNTINRIIWIGWNISRPNPRLSAYIIPSLIDEISKNINKIILVSSLDASKKNAPDKRAASEIEFNTFQKIKFLIEFRNKFFPESPSTQFEPHEESNEIDEIQWILLWNELEKVFTHEEKEFIFSTFSKFIGKDAIDKAKIYSVRHAFWFFDIWFQSTLSNLESIWWPQEIIFNIIREKISILPIETLERLVSKKIIKNKVHRIIYPYASKVIQYWDATRKTGSQRVSIEYPVWKSWEIWAYYNSRLQKKSQLDSDISLIHRYVNPQDYQDFWYEFSTQYEKDFSNI